MTQIAILPEMITAGEEALDECDAAGADKKTTAIQVYAAMEAVRMMVVMDSGGSIH